MAWDEPGLLLTTISIQKGKVCVCVCVERERKKEREREREKGYNGMSIEIKPKFNNLFY